MSPEEGVEKKVGPVKEVPEVKFKKDLEELKTNGAGEETVHDPEQRRRKTLPGLDVE